MRLKTFVILAALAFSLGPITSAFAQGVPVTTEKLVLTTATKMPRNTTTGLRVAIEIQNLGPNPIYCAFSSATAVVLKARAIEAKVAATPADSWAVDVTPDMDIWCIAATANQVTTAATVVSELLK